MGLKDLAQNLADKAMPFDSSPSSAAVSRSLVRGGRALLEVRPDWAGGEADQKRLTAIIDGLETALANIDGRLVMGLLGGTGVGKSTLISALAGETISKASVVRPTTSRPLIYRHESFPPLTGFSGQEIIHQVQSLRALAIVDFPDFDSLETAHHRLVLERLKELDLVVWVTDHNKYADRRLYEVMRMVRQVAGSTSQVMVLNKVDELLKLPDGSEALKDVLSSLAGQLLQFGEWAGPVPWPVSAAESLASPEDRSAGGLGGLRDLLDSLADAKIRRTVELGNLEARNESFREHLKRSARPEQWLSKLQALNKLAEDFHPLAAVEGDLASLSLLRPLYLAPRLDRIRKKSTGLLALFTDGWAFIASKFNRSGESELPPAAPPPAAPGFVQHLLGRAEDYTFLTGEAAPVNGEELARESEAVIEKALNDYYYTPKDPGPSAWMLALWPFVLALLLIWAENGGQFGGPAAVTAAALRSAVPWCIFSLIGGAVLTNFIWFRVRRRLETYFQKALEQSRADLLKLADDRLAARIRQAIARQSLSLDRLADLKKNSGE